MIQMCNYHYSRSPINILRNKKNSNLSRTLSFSNKCGTVSFPKQRSKTWTNKNIRLNGRNGKSATPCNGQLCELYAAAVKGTHKLITERKDGTAVGSLFQWKNRIGTGCGKRRKVEVGISIWELAAHRTQYGWMGARHAAAAAAHNADGMNERSAAPNNGSGCVAASTNAACNRQSRWKLRASWSRRLRRSHDHSQCSDEKDVRRTKRTCACQIYEYIQHAYLIYSKKISRRLRWRMRLSFVCDVCVCITFTRSLNTSNYRSAAWFSRRLRSN